MCRACAGPTLFAAALLLLLLPRPPGEIVAGELHALPTLLPYQGGVGAGLLGVF